MADDSGIPEPRHRREALELHDRCAAALVAGYRIVFTSHYRRSGFFDSRARARL